MKFFLTLLVICCHCIAFGSDNKRPAYPKDYFSSPVDLDIYLSGTFGEVRSSHFHSGIDIKTAQREGLNIFASASGYVSRIKVSPYGFGKALYLTHPNGYVTVYAHLQRFSPEIEAYVKQQQYNKKSFRIELFPGPDRLQVNQGELIAISGNTGGSAGPHLHFEIRDGATQKPINPLLFGFEVKDNIPPVMDLLAVYEYRNGERQPAQLYPVKGQSSDLQLSVDTLFVNQPKIAFGVRSYDRLNGAANKNGLYSLKMFENEQLKYHFEVEKFAFSETRYVKCHVDHQLKHDDRKVLQRCHLLPGNYFSGYKHVVQKGVINVEDDAANFICIEADDAAGNVSVLKFIVKYQKDNNHVDVLTTPSNIVKTFQHDRYNTYGTNDFKITLPKGVLFEDLKFEYDTSMAPVGSSYSVMHHIHQPTVAVFKYFNISLKSIQLPTRYQSKALIVSVGEDGSVIAEGGSFENGFVKTRTRSFGDYYVMIDTTAPSIRALNFGEGQTVTAEKELKVRITDDLSGIQSYEANVDGEWILMEYDAKRDLLFHEFDEKIKPGSHEFVLRVKDAKGNLSTFKTNFNR